MLCYEARLRRLEPLERRAVLEDLLGCKVHGAKFVTSGDDQRPRTLRAGWVVEAEISHLGLERGHLVA